MRTADRLARHGHRSDRVRIHRCIALVITALSLTMTAAHVLEMPRKLSYSIALYTAVNATPYPYFAIFGAIFELGAILAVGTLAWRARHQPSAHWTLAAAIAVTLSLLSWLILVQPVNSAIAHGASWGDLRLRWELGHLVGFVLSLAGLVALAIATVRDLPVPDRTIRVETARVIRATPERCVALYLDFGGWSRLFPVMIRAIRNLVRHGTTTTLDVDHVTAGVVRNVVTVVSASEIVLDEVKPHYRARFVNRFEPHPEGCRYTVGSGLEAAGITTTGAFRGCQCRIRVAGLGSIGNVGPGTRVPHGTALHPGHLTAGIDANCEGRDDGHHTGPRSTAGQLRTRDQCHRKGMDDGHHLRD